MSRHPSVEAVNRFFETGHLPEPLKAVMEETVRYRDTILSLIAEDDPELTVGLRKLLEAKDCFIRAKVAEVNKAKGNSNEGAPLPRPNEIV